MKHTNTYTHTHKHKHTSKRAHTNTQFIQKPSPGNGSNTLTICRCQKTYGGTNRSSKYWNWYVECLENGDEMDDIIEVGIEAEPIGTPDQQGQLERRLTQMTSVIHAVGLTVRGPDV
jgi:hypothetical protein